MELKGLKIPEMIIEINNLTLEVNRIREDLNTLKDIVNLLTGMVRSNRELINLITKEISKQTGD